MVMVGVTSMTIGTRTFVGMVEEEEESGIRRADVGFGLDAVIETVEEDVSVDSEAVVLTDALEVDDLVDEASGSSDSDSIVVGVEPVFEGNAMGEGAASRLQSLGVWLSFCVILKRPLQ